MRKLVSFLKNLTHIVRFINVDEGLARYKLEKFSTSVMLGSFFGLGFSKVAPGTLGSLAACIIGSILVLIGFHLVTIFLLIFIIIGFVVSEDIVSNLQEKDPQFIIIDEIAGQTIPFLLFSEKLLHLNFINVLIVFICFRVFDILKPSIIRKSETKLKGGSGVMVDDLISGLFSLIVSLLIIIIFRN